MADEAAKIAVSVEMDLNTLRANMNAAQTMVANSAKTMETSVKASTQAMGSEFEKLARRANIALGVQAAVGGLRVAQGLAAGLRGDFEGMQRAIEQLPFGLGAAAGVMHSLAAQIVGLDESLARLAGVQAQAGADASGVAFRRSYLEERELNAARTRTMLTVDPELRARLEFEEELIRITSEMKRWQLEALEKDVILSEEVIAERREQLVVMAEIKTQQKVKEIRDAAARDEADAAFRANADSARLIEENRRNERQKKYRETLKDIEREMKARQESQAIMQEQLAAARGVTGANFVTSIGTAIGSMRVGTPGGAEEVGRAQIRAANLLADIKDNTAEMAKLAGERDFVSSLR